MVSNLAGMRAGAEELVQRFEEVAAQLEEAATALRQGSPASVALEEHLAAARTEFESLRAAALQAATSGADSPDIRTLPAIIEKLDELTAQSLSGAIHQMRLRALAVLDNVLALRHVSNPEFNPLLKCQRPAELARSEILKQTDLEQHPYEAELAEGSHPLTSLSRLVNEMPEIDDETIERLDNDIRLAYGSALALAAVRGLLKVSSEKSQRSPELSNGDDTAVTDERPAQTRADSDERDKNEPLQEGPTDATASSESPAEPSPEPTALGTESTSLIARVRGDDQTAVEDLAWQLLAENRAEAAFQLISVFRSNDQQLDAAPWLLPWMVRPLLLGPHIGYPNSEVFRALREDYSNFRETWLAQGRQDWRTAIGLLLAAGAFRPALLAPATGASTVLRSLHLGPGLEQTYELTCLLAEHAERQNPLEITALRGASTQAEWQREQELLQTEVETWLAQVNLRTLIFRGATNVWRAWVSSGGVIAGLLDGVLQWNTGNLDGARKDCERYADEATFRKLVYRTDREVVGRKRGQDISAAALSQLRRGFHDAADLVRRAHVLASSRPGQGRDYLARQARDLQAKVTSLHDGVFNELSRLQSDAESPLIQGAVPHVISVLANITALVANASQSRSEPDSGELIQSVLLKSTAVTLDDAWAPMEKPPVVRDAVLALVETPQITWEQAFEHQVERGDHAATRRVVGLLEASGMDASRIEQLSVRRDEAVDERLASLTRLVQSVVGEVESAVAAGIVGDAERSALLGRVESIQGRAVNELRFHIASAHLDAVRQEIKSNRMNASKQLRSAMKAASIEESHEAFARIERAISAGDVLVANEYLDYARRGEPIPDKRDTDSAFEEFFPKALRALTTALDAAELRNTNDIVRIVQQGGEIGGLLFTGDNDTSGQAAEFMQAWVNLGRSKANLREAHICAVLAHLGFVDPKVTAIRRMTPRFKVFQARIELVSDRRVCPTPAFGSTAGGRYRIICALDRPNEEDLAAEVDRSSDGSPTIVFYLGVFSERHRRLLARLSRQKPRLMVVLDMALALFLATRPGGRLRAFFECALPFTCLEPFSTTAGLVPPEMFFGRERERQSIVDPQGSCFIYGGRQLGKTALLRHVVRTFHALENGRIAIWIDLRPAGIGLNRRVDEIWNVIALELKRVEVLPRRFPDHAGPEKLAKEVEGWLGDDEHRRIVLMLDEADRFLESDAAEGAHPFRHSGLLKGLMDRSDRRFKVVFAGLHNVQRATRHANHPLAHFNDPLCIGPLIDGGEAQEARALVEQPFLALGYRFAGTEPVMRILAQSNYYPSLIQLYCAQLLRHVTSPRGLPFNQKHMPPYSLELKHVEAAYTDQELWKQVQDRFKWTLHLDQRYEVIAYSIALESKADLDRLNEGFDARWIRDQALLFWEEGFRESRSEEAIRVIGDEMIGLGILRAVPGSRYALRNANVLSMMGTDAVIADALERHREPPVEYEASAFRSVLSSDEQHGTWPRSPLTALQAERLRSRDNNVTMVCGTKAGGLDTLANFCREATAAHLFYEVRSDVTTLAELERTINAAIKTRTESVSIVFVGSAAPWTGEWVDWATRRLARLTRTREFVKIVFEAGPERLWNLLTASDDHGLTNDHLPLIVSVTPWKDAAVRQFLEDSNKSGDNNIRDKLRDLTGNWPGLIDEFRKLLKSSPTVSAALDGLSELWQASAWRSAALAGWGLNSAPVITSVMRDFATVGDATVADLADVIPGVSADEVRKTVRWAELLALVESRRDGKWAVEPTLHRALTYQ